MDSRMYAQERGVFSFDTTCTVGIITLQCESRSINRLGLLIHADIYICCADPNWFRIGLFSRSFFLYCLVLDTFHVRMVTRTLAGGGLFYAAITLV